MRIEVLQPFGVAISDIDASLPLDEPVADALRALYRRHRLLVLRGQRLTPAQQTRFTALFDGAVAAVDDGVISNADTVGKLGDSALAFHSDYAFTAEPLLTIALHAIEVEDDRSATLFVPVALDGLALPEALARRLGALATLTVYGIVPDRRNHRSVADTLPSHVHPAIVPHPRTGEPILFVSQNQSAQVVGLPPAESDALLAELDAILYDPDRIHRHVWRAGDLVLWDNVALQHGRAAVGQVGRRSLQRSVIGGTFADKCPELAAAMA